MPRDLTSDMIAHLSQDVTTLATCWRITATDGTVLGFTNHTSDLSIDSVDYIASAGIAPTTAQARTGLAVDNMDIQAILDSDSLTESDIYAGRWDFAAVLVFLVNYEDLDMGTIVFQKGKLGEVKSADGMFVAETRSLLQAASQQIVVLTTPNCRAKHLGDAECGVDLEPFTKTGAVATVTSRRVFTVSGDASGQADHYFRYGTIEFTSGDNDGRKMEIKDNVGSSITLQQPMPFAVTAADTVILIAGCDRTRATCRDVFSNIINFRGEPDIPGNDAQQSKAKPA